MNRNSARPSLVEKISGPNAVPLSALVKRGEVAAQRVRESFGGFLHQRIQELAKMRSRLADHAAWQELYAAVVDLRGSAAMVDEAAVGAICRSLEALLKDRIHDARTITVVASHIDALVLVSSDRKPGSGALRILVQELAQAAERIPLRLAGV